MSPARSPGSVRRRAWRSPLAWLVLAGVVALGLCLDLGLKRWSFNNVAGEPVVPDRQEILQSRDWQIPPHDPVPVIPKLLNLHLVKNEGAVFGIGSNQRMFFIAFTLAALSAALLVFARWTTSRAVLAHAAIGLIMAGGLGNLYDRLWFTFVRDFLHLLPGWKLPFGWRWPGGSDGIFPWVFNVADVMLLLGMGMLMLHMNSLEKRRKLAQAAAGQESPERTQPESA